MKKFILALLIILCPVMVDAKIIGHNITKGSFVPAGKHMKKNCDIKLVNIDTEKFTITLFDAQYNEVAKAEYYKTIVANQTDNGQTSILKDGEKTVMERKITYTQKEKLCVLEVYLPEGHYTLSGNTFITQ